MIYWLLISYLQPSLLLRPSSPNRKGFIIDTRTPTTSQSEKSKGGGYESEQYYTGWRRINKSIDRYHFLLDSYSKLMEACSDSTSSSEKWLSRLTISSWLTHIKDILNCGCLIAQLVDKVIMGLKNIWQNINDIFY